MIQTITKIIIFILFISSGVDGQKNVYLKVDHMLGTEKLEMNKKVTNDLGTDFNITRLDYFISNITLFHDNGQEKKLKDLYLLIRNGENVNQLLGNFDIQNLDSISFYVGIDPENNHADPSLWPADHALAPKSPDMHWGWAAGYRFVAIEGNNGPDLAYQFQLHALGDELLKTVTIKTNGQIYQDDIMVSLTADCATSMAGIDLNKVVFIHGSTREAATLLRNFGTKVFSETASTSSVVNDKIGQIKISPNPVTGSNALIKLDKDQMIDGQITIWDMSGNAIQVIHRPGLINEIELTQPGMYIIELKNNGKLTYRSAIIKH